TCRLSILSATSRHLTAWHSAWVVNRFGKGDAQVEIVHCADTSDQASKKKTKEQRQFEEASDRTFLLLQKLPKRADGRYDGSPAELEGLKAEDRQAAFTPSPVILAA